MWACVHNNGVEVERIPILAQLRAMLGVSNEIGVQVKQIGRNKQMNVAEHNSELQENMHQVCGLCSSGVWVRVLWKVFINTSK